MKKIMVAVFAISAIALLNSCGNVTSGPVDFPNGAPATQMSQHSAGYNVGEREQTETGDITYTGTIDGQFLDADMVPVRLCDGQIVWAKFADNLYKVAVEMNQIIVKGGSVEVSMQEVNWYWFWRRFEIKGIVLSISGPLPLEDLVTPPAVVPVVKKSKRSFVPNPQPQTQTVVIQQQPCCCGTNITINGTNNAPIITGNGNNLGGIGNTVPVQKLEPVCRPITPQKFDSVQAQSDSLSGSLKKKSKREPWILPWS